MVEGLCLDVMHALDEGVSRYFLQMLVEGCEKFALLPAQLSAMDALWKAVVPSSLENRRTRSIRDYKMFKAHELRLFLQIGLPFVTKAFVSKEIYRVFCTASRIAWLCTSDSIAPGDVVALEELCSNFMREFEAVFGVAEMKFSIHLMSHVW